MFKQKYFDSGKKGREFNVKDLSNNNVIHINENGFQYLQFRRLIKYNNILTHAYSLGIDRNFRTARAKNLQPLSQEEIIMANKDYKELCNAIGANYINIVKPNQAHTKNIQKIENKVNKDIPDFNLDKYNSTDGLITNKSKIILSTTNADCILMIFFYPIKKVIANIHSGWRGTIQRISKQAILKMQKEYECNPEDIICCICPSIRKCHFEVEEDVKTIFENEFTELDLNNIIEKKSENKWLIDTIKINKEILQNVGLKRENIIDCGICSVCNSDLIHSYRVEKEGYGLGTALIGLK